MAIATVPLRIGEAIVSANTDSSSSSRQRRKARRRKKTGRAGIGMVLKCRFVGGRRYRPVSARRTLGGSGVRHQRMSGDELIVMDEESERVFGLVLAFLRGGAQPDDQQEKQRRKSARVRGPPTGVYARTFVADDTPMAQLDAASKPKKVAGGGRVTRRP
ncbi:unnamed protein product [Ectocarpus fasciculatus]